MGNVWNTWHTHPGPRGVIQGRGLALLLESLVLLLPGDLTVIFFYFFLYGGIKSTPVINLLFYFCFAFYTTGGGSQWRSGIYLSNNSVREGGFLLFVITVYLVRCTVVARRRAVLVVYSL